MSNKVSLFDNYFINLDHKALKFQKLNLQKLILSKILVIKFYHKNYLHRLYYLSFLFFKVASKIVTIAAKTTPAIGQIIHVRPQFSVRKLINK